MGRGIVNISQPFACCPTTSLPTSPPHKAEIIPSQGTVPDVMAFNARLSNPAPLDYTTPPFPSLYWPYQAKPGVANYLYYASDIWRYTLLWTLIIFAVIYLVVAAFAVLMQIGKRKTAWQYVWIIPVFYTVVAGFEALLSGSIVGLIIGAVYNAGYFRMSTWIPFVWAVINVLVLILSSFSIHGGL